MVTINHNVVKPLPSATTTSKAPSSHTVSPDAVTSVSPRISTSISTHNAWAKEAYQQLQYDSPDGKHQKALSAYNDVMMYSRRSQLSALVGIDIVV